MCAYLLSMTTNRMYSLSPDAVRETVRLDGETAVRLLDKKVLEELPACFVSTALAAFRAIIGNGERKRDK